MHKTALNERHHRLGAKMTDFHGWEMPIYYTSILEEHKAVRQALGIFDVSHMGQVLVSGPDAANTLNHLMVSDLSQVGEGRACYTLMLNPAGGIIDDLIIYRLGGEAYLVIVNCGNRERDVTWLKAHRQGATTITDISEGRSILAVQGPLACRALEQILDARVTSLARFGVAPLRTMGPDACLARTGYTGSDGFELFLPDRHAQRLWDTVLNLAKPLGAQPIGLGARDTLRIEAGLRLYGTDMDEGTTPLEAGLEWTVAFAKPDFIGKAILLKQKQQGLTKRFIGFELVQGPIPRAGMELSVHSADAARPPGPTFAGAGAGGNHEGRAGGAGGRKVGTVTSGTFSPILGKPLGMGYAEPDWTKPGTTISVTVRNHRYDGTVVKLPFWKGEARQPVLTTSALGARPTLEKL